LKNSFSRLLIQHSSLNEGSAQAGQGKWGITASGWGSNSHKRSVEK